MSSSSNPRWLYDVFISFRGEDTRPGFVSHLYSALSNAGVNTFIDDAKLVKGMEVEPDLKRAIEGSHIALVVFSQNYSESYWCLRELELIVDCHSDYGQLLLPIFYHVPPSHVRKQTGDFGKALNKLAERRFGGNGMLDLLLRWGRILTQATRLIGWHITDSMDEAEIVKKIVEGVLEKLDNTLLPITEFPVGLESRVQRVIGFMKNKSSKNYMVGIWGMGGSGKTTMAKAIYNKIRCEFEYQSFIENVGQGCENDNRGHIRLQEQLLSDVLKRKVNIQSISIGRTMIKAKLLTKSLLVVLDDLTEIEQIEAIDGNSKWTWFGSVLIVTTRDLHLLNLLQVDCVFQMDEMDGNESLELFSWHAFREKSPRENFSILSRKIVTHCGGLPLTLEVLGSYLYERTQGEWKSLLSKLKKIPSDKVKEKLRISYDDLDGGEKNVFLDICCFFIGKDRAYVAQILNGCGFCPKIEIAVLIERSLIKIEKTNKLAMHNLLRDLGRDIVYQSSPKKPEKRSRLGAHEDVLDVFTRHAGTKAIEGLALKLQRPGEVCFNSKTFEKMKRLRILKFNDVKLVGDYKYLPKELRWVCWQGFPLKHLPDNFDPKNVVAIELKNSNLKLLWREAPRILDKLKYLNLSHSMSLKHTPDFSQLPNLEKLILENCTSLTKVHQSIGNLNSLHLLNLKKCGSLRNLPRRMYRLKSLETLILTGCSKIAKLDEDIEQMESLTTLIANNTTIKEVPRSIVRLKSIGYVSLCGFEGLASNIVPSIIWSWMSPTMNSRCHVHPSWDMSSSLVSMDVQNNTLGDLAPMLSSFSKLRSIWVQCCTVVQLTQEVKRILDGQYGVNFTELKTTSYASQVSDVSMRSLLIGMGSCGHLIDIVGNNILQGLTMDVSNYFFPLPGDNDPVWLTHTGEGCSVYFKVPQDFPMQGMLLCVVYSTILKETAISFNNEDWLGIVSNLGPGDKVEIFVHCLQGFSIKKTAVYLIRDEESRPKGTIIAELNKQRRDESLQRFREKRRNRLQVRRERSRKRCKSVEKEQK
ncbi:hypothetical protein RJT34_21940 [Clitoria ternatea]|uniref:TIR domain-containing protein n=1 Tax=Clitoria ternatea TaxID=43366 RepID=A0AAN9P6V9_CLITE